MKRKISIGTWCFCFIPYKENPFPFETVLKRVSELKYDGISLDGHYAYPAMYPTLESRKDLAKKIAGYGLGVSEYAMKLGMVEGVVIQYQPDTWLEAVKENLKFMGDCGFGNMRVDTRAVPSYMVESDYNRAWDTTVNAFRRAADIAADQGVMLCWEPEPGFLFNKPSEILRMYDDVGKDNFKIEFDTSHLYHICELGSMQYGGIEKYPGGMLAFIKACKGKLALLHLIDNDGTIYKGVTAMHNQFGTGHLDFDKLLPAFRDDAGYTGEWWVVDLVFHDDVFNVVATAKEYIDKMNEKYGDY